MADLAQKINQRFKDCKLLYLDVGHTLLFPQQSPGLVYAKIATQLGVDVQPKLLEAAFRQQWPLNVSWRHKKNQGKCSEALLQEFWRRLVGLCFEQVAVPLPKKTFVTAYDYYAQASAWRVNQPILGCVQTLLQQGWQVGLLSNWDFRLPKLLQQLGIEHYFKPQLFSAQVGWEKPHPNIYQIAIQQTGLDARQILMIGDDLTNDVQIPQAMNMQAWHLEDWQKTG